MLVRPSVLRPLLGPLRMASTKPSSVALSPDDPAVKSLVETGWKLVPLPSSGEDLLALQRTWDFASNKDDSLRAERKDAWAEAVRWLHASVLPVTDRFNVRSLPVPSKVSMVNRSAASSGRPDPRLQPGRADAVHPLEALPDPQGRRARVCH